MRVYLSVPMVANRAIERAEQMARAIVDTGNILTSPWVLGELGASDPDLNVFQRDLEGVERSDLILADLTEPSVGVGMEIMAAHKAGVPVVVLARRGSPVSKMLLHMKNKVLLTYDDGGDVYGLVSEALKRNPPKVE
ncbi:MAG TPA: nucleoside 2-deoxyribosyltransferase [Nitrososphaerales archaeon]|nr:nucleoside 2-deoxyribosyltransferase [Nitrososphaerales archaeon]